MVLGHDPILKYNMATEGLTITSQKCYNNCRETYNNPKYWQSDHKKTKCFFCPIQEVWVSHNPPKAKSNTDHCWPVVTAVTSCYSGTRCRPPHPQLISGQRWLAGEKRHLQTSLLHLLHLGQLGPLPVLRTPAVPTMGLLLLAAAREFKSQNKGSYRIW